jgi:methionyl-tRNA synthetase
MESFLVTATPPTPNGDLHVGHLSGPFLAADVFCRFQRMRGNRSVYATGSDDHQSYVLTRAEREERDPVRLADDYAEQIQATLRSAGVQVDRFSRALGDPAHRETVEEMFRALVERGFVVRKRHRALRCGTCDRLLFEGFVRGWCPRCGVETPGHLCEMCGWVNDPGDLIEPICSFCHGETESVEWEGLFLPLEAHRRRLEGFWATRTSWRPHLRAYCEAMLAQPLPEYPVSHPGGWGIPVPVDGFGHQVVNVWLEMYAGHVHAARSTAGLGGAAGAPDFTLVQFLGHDNSFYNAVLHTAVSLALGGDWPVPEHVITNEFYFLEGRKFSTSRNHVVPGRDAVAMAGPDCFRYHLARTNPERWQTSFSPKELLATGRDEIRGVWAVAVEELQRLAASGPSGGEARGSDLRLTALLDGGREDLERCYGLDGFSLRRASSILLDLAAAGRDFATRALEAEPGPVAVSRSTDAAVFLRTLCLLAAPLLPGLSQEAWERAGGPGKVAEEPWPGRSPTLRPGGRRRTASGPSVGSGVR